MRILLLIFVALLVLIGLVILIGFLLPRQHRVSREIALNAPPAKVYAIVRDFASAPSWRSDLRTTEMLDSKNGRFRFRECSKNGCVNYEVMEDIPKEKLVTRILDQNLGYSGSWTYEFAAAAQGTRLRITEAGEVSNLFFRFMSRFVFGQTRTIDTYLKSLGKRFGLEVAPK